MPYGFHVELRRSRLSSWILAFFPISILGAFTHPFMGLLLFAPEASAALPRMTSPEAPGMFLAFSEATMASRLLFSAAALAASLSRCVLNGSALYIHSL